MHPIILQLNVVYHTFVKGGECNSCAKIFYVRFAARNADSGSNFFIPAVRVPSPCIRGTALDRGDAILHQRWVHHISARSGSNSGRNERRKLRAMPL